MDRVARQMELAQIGYFSHSCWYFNFKLITFNFKKFIS